MEEEEIVITDEEAQMELEQLLMERGWDALFGSSDSIFFGGSDFDDRRFECMRQFTGELVCIGLSRVDSKTLLAGSETFRPST